MEPTLPQAPGAEPEAPTLTRAPADAAATLAPALPAAPGPVGLLPAGYEMVRELGRGGMGVVYQARQTSLGRLVALKMILAGGHASAAALRRFRGEAEAVAKLQHPHIVQVHEIGEHDGRPFMVLEFVNGGSLDHLLDGTPWPPEAAARFTATLAEAMDVAHRQGIVHRDLKPGNILLHHPEGTAPDVPGQATAAVPKITDFGLAKNLNSEGNLTASGAIMGTPSYMAPEQAKGERDASPAMDVYALGAILYELLTGRPPFKAANAVDTVMQVATEEPVPPRSLQPKLPTDLDTIVLKCLQKEPRRRYATAGALAADLRRFTTGEPILARPVGWGERAWKWARRHPAVAGLSVTLAVVLPAAFAGMTLLFLDAQAQRQQAERDAAVARTQSQRAEEKEKLAQEREAAEKAASYRQRLTLAQFFWREGDPKGMRQVLHEVPPEKRGWEWHYLERLRRGDRWSARGHTDFAVSPDGKVLATPISDEKGHVLEVALLESATGREVRRLTHPDAAKVACVAFSRDGSLLITGGESGEQQATRGHVWLWNRTDGVLLGELGEHTSPVRDLALHPTEPVLAVGCFEPTHLYSTDAATRNARRAQPGIHLWNLTTKQKVSAFRNTSAGKNQPADMPANVSDFLEVANASVERLVFTADGNYLITSNGTADSAITCWNWRERKLASSFSFSVFFGMSEIGRPTPLPESSHILLLSRRLARGLITANEAAPVLTYAADTGRKLGTLALPAPALAAAVHPHDPKVIACGGVDGAIRVVDATSGKEIMVHRGHETPIVHLAFAPDGQALYALDRAGHLKAWPAAPRTAYPGRAALSLDLAFGPEPGQLCVLFGPAFLTGMAPIYVVTMNGTPVREWVVNQRSTMPTTFARNGRFLAVPVANPQSVWRAVRAADPPAKPNAAPEEHETKVEIWDTAAGRLHGTVAAKSHHPFSSHRPAFDPTGARLLTSRWHRATPKDAPTPTADLILELRDVANLQLRATQTLNLPIDLNRDENRWNLAVAATFSSDGQRAWLVLTRPRAKSSDRQFMAWYLDGQTLQVLGHYEIAGPTFAQGMWAPRNITFLPGHRDQGLIEFLPLTVNTGVNVMAGEIARLNLATGAVLAQWRVPGPIAVSPDGHRLATGAPEPQTILIWDLMEAKPSEPLLRMKLPQAPDWVERLLFSPDGQHLAAAFLNPRGPSLVEVFYARPVAEGPP
jgi:WD40 repeat protein